MRPKRLDAVLAGVGGQGVLSIGALIAGAASDAGLWVKQSEVHGMSQRGGAVEAYLRISDRPIKSDLIARGGADLILSLEPVEALRHLELLKPDGVVVSASEPVENVPDYPDLERVLERLRRLPHAVVVDAQRLAREAGNPKGANVVLVGAASSFLPVPPAAIEGWIHHIFDAKGGKTVDANLKAFRAGCAVAAASAA
jgi:indolepyruvate ferredoxin oxidoreductase beta subunit